LDIGGLLERHEPPPERPIYAVGPEWKARSLRLGRWKLIVTAAEAGNPERCELFDLAADPAEARDLAADRPAEVARLREALVAAAARDNDARATTDR
jgi:arylsulfatase A-like enzyme